MSASYLVSLILLPFTNNIEVSSIGIVSSADPWKDGDLFDTFDINDAVDEQDSILFRAFLINYAFNEQDGSQFYSFDMNDAIDEQSVESDMSANATSREFDHLIQTCFTSLEAFDVKERTESLKKLSLLLFFHDKKTFPDQINYKCFLTLCLGVNKKIIPVLLLQLWRHLLVYRPIMFTAGRSFFSDLHLLFARRLPCNDSTVRS